MMRQAVRRIAATAPPLESVWAKALAVEARMNALADANGIMRYTGNDSNTYSLGTYRQHLAANVTINQATSSPQGIMQSVPLLAGVTYRVEGMFLANQGGVNSSQMFGWTGPAVSFTRIFVQFSNQTTNSTNAWTNLTGLGAANGFSWTGAAGNTVELRYIGTIVPTANAPLTAFGACSNVANTYSMISGTIMDVSAE